MQQLFTATAACRVSALRAAGPSRLSLIGTARDMCGMIPGARHAGHTVLQGQEGFSTLSCRGLKTAPGDWRVHEFVHGISGNAV